MRHATPRKVQDVTVRASTDCSEERASAVGETAARDRRGLTNPEIGSLASARANAKRGSD